MPPAQHTGSTRRRDFSTHSQAWRACSPGPGLHISEDGLLSRGRGYFSTVAPAPWVASCTQQLPPPSPPTHIPVLSQAQPRALSISRRCRQPMRRPLREAWVGSLLPAPPPQTCSPSLLLLPRPSSLCLSLLLSLPPSLPSGVTIQHVTWALPRGDLASPTSPPLTCPSSGVPISCGHGLQRVHAASPAPVQAPLVPPYICRRMLLPSPNPKPRTPRAGVSTLPHPLWEALGDSGWVGAQLPGEGAAPGRHGRPSHVTQRTS